MDERNTNSPISEKQNSNWLLPASILVAGIIIAVAVIYSTGAKNINTQEQNQNEANNGNQNQQQAGMPSINSTDVVLGDNNAPITIIEFGDYQCPFCAKFWKEIEFSLIKNYIDTGKVKFVFKPVAIVDSIVGKGTESKDSVNAVKCASEQGKFWQFHDALFEIEFNELNTVSTGSEGNGNLNITLFNKIATNLGMNVKDFTSCYNSGRHKDDDQKYMQEAQEALPNGVGTPAVFLNGKKVEFSMNSKREFDFTAFSAVIDKVLEKK
ncbi:hypothetical protein COV23_00105 [Candidatus Wolfebacteria bacterium CG10_big_fil_rev_8_21_14_0_10_31_9]|uniref:Thioredoxin domain-containing protein n=1 Tax=Candidatus Wolfebacteria bacterium CG10_big_fil_rev_8_21_14_0_10_31_9 TaxID=1975070 RepID=A0A2H0RD36_9BACT|nr:MAG: hypothetical protein COV23_00105 [Candidatus Wolfebacteria bacterium CG10_big_fil_rev_8_21_14_0_10_31_9]